MVATEGSGAKEFRPANRIANLPPYLFAEADRQIAAKRAAGFDVVSLGVGDPDLPTPASIVDELKRTAESRRITAIRVLWAAGAAAGHSELVPETVWG